MSTDIATMIPIIDPNRAHRRWRDTEIYTGPSGTGRYVPNVDDEVFSWNTGLRRVVSVDYSTGLSVLEAYVAPVQVTTVDSEDILLGAGPGYQSESYRVYIDDSVIPHTLALDSRLFFYGSNSSYIKLFVGSDISSTGEIVSTMYDQGGTLLGDNIPLELVVLPVGQDNIAVKAPMVGYATRSLPDNEVVTVVAYNDAGHVLSIARVLVMNTAFIRTVDVSKKYIRTIYLESPFLSTSDDRTLEYPINLPVEAMELRGIVNYSDGTRAEMAVDGDKFALHGLSNFVSTIAGQEIDLVLSYYLSDEEFVYGASTGVTKHISVNYNAKTTMVDGAYSVKLFVAPVWVNAIEGYRLRWFLYNLERKEVYEVTQYAELAVNSRSFNPTEYGTMQNISIAINMKDVNSDYTNYRHTQTIGIALMTQGTNDQDNWNINYVNGQSSPYGKDLRASLTFINTNNWVVNLNSGYSNFDEWLDNVYYNSQPLIHPEFETAPPKPNYFTLVMGVNTIECPIEQWNQNITLQHGVADGDVVMVEFILRSATADLQLGMGVLPVHLDDHV